MALAEEPDPGHFRLGGPALSSLVRGEGTAGREPDRADVGGLGELPGAPAGGEEAALRDGGDADGVTLVAAEDEVRRGALADVDPHVAAAAGALEDQDVAEGRGRGLGAEGGPVPGPERRGDRRESRALDDGRDVETAPGDAVVDVGAGDADLTGPAEDRRVRGGAGDLLGPEQGEALDEDAGTGLLGELGVGGRELGHGGGLWGPRRGRDAPTVLVAP